MHVIKMVGSLFLLFCPGGPALAQSNIAIPADLLRQFSEVGATGAAVKLWLFITVIILLATVIINRWCPKMYADKRRANKKQRRRGIFEVWKLKIPFAVPVAVGRI